MAPRNEGHSAGGGNREIELSTFRVRIIEDNYIVRKNFRKFGGFLLSGNREIERSTFCIVTLSPRFISVTSYNNQIGQIQNNISMKHAEIIMF